MEAAQNCAPFQHHPHPEVPAWLGEGDTLSNNRFAFFFFFF